MSAFVQRYDPNDLARYFSNEDSLGMHTPDVIDFPTFQASLDQVKDLLERIPDWEADLIMMHYVFQKKQIDLAKIFVAQGRPITQAAISYRLSKGIKRLKFLLELPKIDDIQMRSDLEDVLDDPLDVEILVRMYRTTCQSVVARELDLNQCYVRNHYIKSVEILNNMSITDPRYEIYSRAFGLISDNFNILHEIVYCSAERLAKAA